jgi:hypothetical protein
MLVLVCKGSNCSNIHHHDVILRLLDACQFRCSHFFEKDEIRAIKTKGRYKNQRSMTQPLRPPGVVVVSEP